MKTIILALFASILLSSAATLEFTYDDAPPSNVIARAYYSTNIALPLTNWAVVQTMTNLVQGTNVFPATIVWSTNMPNFFAVSISNEWGEVFSDVLGSWPLQGNGIKLRLSR